MFGPTENCWRIERFALRIDGDAYFHNLRDALLQAVAAARGYPRGYVLAWDIARLYAFARAACAADGTLAAGRP